MRVMMSTTRGVSAAPLTTTQTELKCTVRIKN